MATVGKYYGNGLTRLRYDHPRGKICNKDLLDVQYTLISPPEASSRLTREQTTSLQAIITCSVCQQEFDRPCTTTCGHTFCYTCLQKCVQLQHKCPQCRMHINSMRDTKSIQVIDSLMSIMKKDTTETAEPDMQSFSKHTTTTAVTTSADTAVYRYLCHRCGGRKKSKSMRCNGNCRVVYGDQEDHKDQEDTTLSAMLLVSMHES